MCEKLITNAKLQHSVQTTKNQASLRCKNLLTKQAFFELCIVNQRHTQIEECKECDNCDNCHTA